MRLLSSSRASDWKLSAEVEVLDYRQRQHYDGDWAQLFIMKCILPDGSGVNSPELD